MSTRLSWLGIYTVSAALEHRYGRAATLLISALVVAAYALMTAVTSMTAAGAVLAGGMWSFTPTDVLQFWVMTVGIVLALPPTLGRARGVSGLRDGLPTSDFDTGAGADPAGGVEHWWVFQPEEVPRSATPLVRRDPRRTGRYQW